MPPKQKPRATKPEAFNYTKPQANAILDTLRKAGLPKDADHTHILSCITEDARVCLTEKALEVELNTPAAKRDRAKIRRLLASLEALTPEPEGVSWARIITTSDPYLDLDFMDLRALAKHTFKWAENPTYRGRRKKGLERRFVSSLSAIYFSVTGRVPSRRYDPYTGKEYGPFRAFVYAVMKPTGLLPSPTTVDHLIREVIHKKFPPKRPPVMVKNTPSAR